MSTKRNHKIQSVISRHKQGTVCLSVWLKNLGISNDLQKRYRRSGWLAAIGQGAFIRPDDAVGWQGGLYALQAQAHLPIHVGAMTALAIQGFSHYLRMGAETIFLLAPPKTPYPTWFKNRDWGAPIIKFVRTSILPSGPGLTEHEEKTFSIRISTPERAILECLHLSPDTVDLGECAQIIEGLTTLRPKLLQSLLEQCSSIKVKRLFLYLAGRADHDWVNRLNPSKLDLGSGDRTITKGGVYIAQYGITVPQELARS